MATTDTLIPKLFLGEHRSDNPNCARKEMRQILDTSTGLLVKREVIVFPADNDGIVNPEIIDEFIVPTQYANTTGLTLVLVVVPELPIVAGVARFEFGAEFILTGGSSTKIITTDYWGTPNTGDLTVPSVSGEILVSTITLAKANFGGDAAAAGTTHGMMRVRVRRLNSHANDTLIGNALVLLAQLRET